MSRLCLSARQNPDVDCGSGEGPCLAPSSEGCFRFPLRPIRRMTDREQAVIQIASSIVLEGSRQPAHAIAITAVSIVDRCLDEARKIEEVRRDDS